MKLVPVVLACALALPFLAGSASATPPVCLEKEAGALGISVHVQITCGPEVTITQCPLVGDGPCHSFSTDRILP